MGDNWLNRLKSENRLLIECPLRPCLGTRFQSTGFQGLGPARYQLHDGTEMLLVESAQSMANRLEAACWNESKGQLIESLTGLPYVKVDLGEYGVTSSWQEFHRLNSPYIWTEQVDESGEKFRKDFRSALGLDKPAKAAGKAKKEKEDIGEEKELSGVLDMRKLAKAVFKFDPNSIIHGLFLTKIAGRLRLTRALSAFIEARNVREVESGGVKLDRVFPGGLEMDGRKLDAKAGFGNVPFHRVEFTAEEITAYFNLDLALLYGYGLDAEAVTLLVSLSLLKVRRFLSHGLRLRTACDLEPKGDICSVRPNRFTLPEEADLKKIAKEAIKACNSKSLLAQPAVTEMTWQPGTKKEDKKGANKAE